MGTPCAPVDCGSWTATVMWFAVQWVDVVAPAILTAGIVAYGVVWAFGRGDIFAEMSNDMLSLIWGGGIATGAPVVIGVLW